MIRGRLIREGSPKLLVVGERPGATELKTKQVFSGPSGKLLVSTITRIWSGGLYLMNALLKRNGKLEDHFDETLREAMEYSPDYVLATGPVARIWASRACKHLNVRDWKYVPNPAAALRGLIPIARWVDTVKAALVSFTSEKSPLRIQVTPNGGVVALDVEFKKHPCDGFAVAAATTGEEEIVTSDPETLNAFLEGRNCVVMHNAVNDLVTLRSRGVNVDCEVDCTMTMRGILDQGGSRDLDVLSCTILGVKQEDPPYRAWKEGKVQDSEMGLYALDHARATLGLYQHFRDPAMRIPVYRDVYRPLLKVLAEMSRIPVDLPSIREEETRLLSRAHDIEKELESRSKINWNSPRQVAAYFASMGCTLPLTETGEPSTSEEALGKVNLPEARLLLELRAIRKLLATYLRPIMEYGELRTIYDPVGARTGRMSSKHMNVQNIPPEVRRFVVPPPGYLWLEADYRSAEYAVAAYWSQDPFMISALKSGDIHSYTARLLIGRNPTEEERKAVKAITFTLLYLGSPNRVAENIAKLGGSNSDVEETYKKWWDLHSVYRKKVDALGHELRNKGFFNSDWRFYKFHKGYVTISDLQEAVNYIIQGMASDCTSVSLLNLYRKGYRPLVVVHDSISLAVPEDCDREEVARDVAETMRSVLPGYLDVKVEIKPRWAV